MYKFVDRRDGGRRLAERLVEYRDRPNLLVLGLPRGGVPVAYEVARKLKAELDVLLVRKLGVPGHSEYAMGAIASGGFIFLDRGIVQELGISRAQVDAVIEAETAELERRERTYRDNRPPPQIGGRTIILVDDGIATGASMKVAVQALRAQAPAAIVVAVPAAPSSAPAEFSELADDFVSVILPSNYHAVGQWYQKFGQTSDEEVRDCLAAAGYSTDSAS